VRCQGFGAGARREEGEYLNRSSTDKQRSPRAKDRQPCGLAWGGRLAALLLSHGAILAMLLRRALPNARPKPANPFPIYEMGSDIPLPRFQTPQWGEVGDAQRWRTSLPPLPAVAAGRSDRHSRGPGKEVDGGAPVRWWW
jgi:hypothetical protein